MGPHIVAQQTADALACTPPLAKRHSAPRYAGFRESVELWEELGEEAHGPKPEPAAQEKGLKARGAQKPLGDAEGDAEGETVGLRNGKRSGPEGETAIKLYLREVGRVRLLTPPEEIALAARIKKGDRRARELMIKANLPRVVKVARDYEDMGLPLLDLVSEGNMGLLKAIERFDPAKGAEFPTYSTWWIRRSIKCVLASQSKTIPLSPHLVDKHPTEGP